MRAPTAGLQIMHNGSAIELLDLVDIKPEGQIWRVKPLFVIGAVHEVTIRPTDVCRALHTERKAA